MNLRNIPGEYASENGILLKSNKLNDEVKTSSPYFLVSLPLDSDRLPDEGMRIALLPKCIQVFIYPRNRKNIFLNPFIQRMIVHTHAQTIVFPSNKYNGTCKGTSTLTDNLLVQLTLEVVFHYIAKCRGYAPEWLLDGFNS